MEYKFVENIMKFPEIFSCLTLTESLHVHLKIGNGHKKHVGKRLTNSALMPPYSVGKNIPLVPSAVSTEHA